MSGQWAQLTDTRRYSGILVDSIVAINIMVFHREDCFLSHHSFTICHIVTSLFMISLFLVLSFEKICPKGWNFATFRDLRVDFSVYLNNQVPKLYCRGWGT